MRADDHGAAREELLAEGEGGVEEPLVLDEGELLHDVVGADDDGTSLGDDRRLGVHHGAGADRHVALDVGGLAHDGGGLDGVVGVGTAGCFSRRRRR